MPLEAWQSWFLYDFTPLPNNDAHTPIAHEDLWCVGSQPNSSSDQSQFQLAQQQALLSQAQHQQQQWPMWMASSIMFSPSPLNLTGAPLSSFPPPPTPFHSLIPLPPPPITSRYPDLCLLALPLPYICVFPTGNLTFSMAHTTVDNNIMATLGFDTHNSGLLHSSPLPLLVVGQWCSTISQMKGKKKMDSHLQICIP